MMMPSIFGETLLDDFFEFPHIENCRRANSTSGLMQTDVKEMDENYLIAMNLPGFKKEDIKCELKDGYLTVSGPTNSSKDEKDQEGKYIRRERYSGSCSRSFYVGEDVKQEDISAKFEDGTLKLLVPKKEVQAPIEESRFICIE